MEPYSILVVDDEAYIRRLCDRILRAMGLTAVFASTLKEALREVASQERLDLLLTDLVLSDGRGLEVVRAARLKFPDAKVLVMTGLFSAKKEMGAGRTLNVQERDLLLKPFSISDFETEVRRRLPDGIGRSRPAGNSTGGE